MFWFWMQADRLPSTWPLALNLIGPPSIMRLLMSVRRIASVSVLASAVRARLKASAATRIDSNV